MSGADGGGSYFSSGGEPGHIHSSNDVYGYGYGYGDSFGISSTRLPNGTYSYSTYTIPAASTSSPHHYTSAMNAHVHGSGGGNRTHVVPG